MIIKVKERQYKTHEESGKDYREHWKYFGAQKPSPDHVKKAWKKVQQWHDRDVASGKTSPCAPAMTGMMCLRNCKNRDMDCEECWHFSKYEENKCSQQ